MCIRCDFDLAKSHCLINYKLALFMLTIEGHQYYAVLATEGLPGGANKSKRFNYKGEWANA